MTSPVMSNHDWKTTGRLKFPSGSRSPQRHSNISSTMSVSSAGGGGMSPHYTKSPINRGSSPFITSSSPLASPSHTYTTRHHAPHMMSPAVSGTAYRQSGMTTTTAGSTQHSQYVSSVSGMSTAGRYAETTRTIEGESRVIGERVVEHEIRVPKKIVREEVIEKTIVVPEKFVREEMVEERQVVREKIVEIMRPIIQEKIVEVPQIEYIEKIVEVPEVVVQEKIRQVPKIHVQERLVEVPRVEFVEKIVEVPEVEYREIPIEKVVEVPKYREQVVVREVPIPQYVEKPIPEYVTKEVPHDVERKIPVPVEAVTQFEYRLAKMLPRYKRATYQVFIPRFIEVPVASELMDSFIEQQAQDLAFHVNSVTAQAAPSLCDVENVAAEAKRSDPLKHLDGRSVVDAVVSQWNSGKVVAVQQNAQQFYTNRRPSRSTMPARRYSRDSQDSFDDLQ